MKTPFILRLFFACVPLCFFVLVACQREVVQQSDNTDPQHSSTSAIKIYLTDHQTPVFDSVFIDIQKLEVKLEDDTLPIGGWVNLSIRSGAYNILRFRNGIDTLFATGTLSSNRVQKVRLTLGLQNSVIKNGQSFPLTIKDNDRQVVIALASTNVDVANGQVFFWLDFDAGSSIKVDNSGSGNNNGFELKPHIKAFGKRNTGSIEGKVLPLAASPIIKAVIGSDTATAIPNNSNGEFKIVGLNAGVYTLIVDAQNGYADTTLNNVRVVNKEDAKLPTIIVHQ